MKLDYTKLNSLIPAIIQDNTTNKVLMLGFMNEEALAKTRETGKVTFYSRTKERLWTKGEESGNFLNLVSIASDCDNDSAKPVAIMNRTPQTNTKCIAKMAKGLWPM